MSATETPHRARVLRFLEEHPGASSTAVREGVRGGRKALARALRELEEAGEVENRGTGRRHAWHAMSEASAGGPGSGGPIRFAELFPGTGAAEESPVDALEDVGGIRWAEPGEACEGFQVGAWLAPSLAADLLELSDRQLRRLEKKGLPARGHAGTKEYPTPHVLHWIAIYRAQVEAGRFVEHLPYRVALARILEVEVDAFGPRPREVRWK